MAKQIFFVSGMTCSGCAASITKTFQALDDVQKVTVQHESGKVEVHATRTLTNVEVQEVLPKKYSLLDASMQPKSKLKQLMPLLLIFAFIIGTTALIHRESWSRTSMMYDFMGMFFMIFSFFKLLDIRGFQQSFRQYDPLAAKLGIYGWLYPFLELTLGICFIVDFVPKSILWATIFILGITTIGVVRVLFQKKRMQCACLGSVLNLPMTEATFIENAIMLVMAGWLLL